MNANSEKSVRTRFAPSPTGYMHVGNLRSALYTYLFAKQKGGQFILRIEDTDQARLVHESVQVIYDSLKQTALHWDEGPDLGGPYGPYVQSERKKIYKEYAEKLVSLGHAYPCFCSKENVVEILKSQSTSVEAEIGVDSEDVSVPGLPIKAYDGRCSRLSEQERQLKLHSGIPFVVRQKINRHGETTFTDIVYGSISIKNDQLDDQVLLKSDGLPTYNFANVVDDHVMEITHVMRGCEYISSTPKYILLYRAFGWEPPQTIHLPLIHSSSGKKLSKRDGAVSLAEFLNLGYLPEALLNYIALLGWSPGDNSEFFRLKDLIDRFDIHRIQKSPAVFDEVKLRHINGLHLKAMPPESFHQMASKKYGDELLNRFETRLISALVQTRVDRLSDIEKLVDFLPHYPYPYERAIFEHKKMKTTPESASLVLKDLSKGLEELQEWSSESLHSFLDRYATEKGLKTGQVMWPLRVALTGLASSPGGAVEVALILGKNESLKRIEKSLGLLSGT